MDSSVSGEDILRLTEFVPSNLSLKVFHVSGQKLVGAPAQALVNVLNGHPSLEVIDLYNNDIDNNSMITITT